jgi:hypothetical protein
MLDVAPNPFTEPIKKFIQDLKATKWEFPYLLQTFHLLITLVLLAILSLFFVSLGLVSQISNSFWKVLRGIGDRMSFANPIPSLFYAISATIYFLLFLPFFLLQSPFWLSGWITSKIGFRPFIILLVTVLISVGIYIYQPNLPRELLGKIISFQDSIKTEYFASDSLETTVENPNLSKIGQ